MKDFTDELIQDHSEIRNNYLVLSIPTWRLNFLAKNFWQYYASEDPHRTYPGKLSKDEWEDNLEQFLAAGKRVVVEPEAEIIYNLAKSYLVWLKFYDTHGIQHKIDVFINKTDSQGNSNGTRKIDIRCPLVSQVRTAILDETLSAEEVKVLADILSTRPDKGEMNALEGKLQYKLNASVIEDAFKESAESLGLKVDELDPYNKYFYKGSPGNLADFDVHFNEGIVRIDIKLIRSADTFTVEKEAHDAQFLVCWNWRDQEFITKQTAPSKINIEQISIYPLILERAAKKLKAGYGPLIKIKNSSEDTGKVEYFTFK